MVVRLAGVVLLLIAQCGLSRAYTYNYCQAPLPRYISPAVQSAQLAQVSVFTRHGDRSPTMPLPNENVEWICSATDDVEIVGGGVPNLGLMKRNIYIDPTNPFASEMWSGNCTVGQLTAKGATQHYLLGQQLRSIYISTLRFIPNNFDPTQLTDVWRTQQSAEANLLGLYPLTSRNGQVPVINITPSNIETMYGNSGACPVLAEVIEDLIQDPTFQSHLACCEQTFEPVLTKMNSIANTTNIFGANSSWTTLDFWDNLQARTCHNIPLPCLQGNCINKTDMAALLKEGNFEFTWLTGGAVQNRIATGVFLAEVLDKIDAVLNGTSIPDMIIADRYAYYSGHDSTLAALLNAWNVTDGQWPPYASNLLMETWKSKTGSDVWVRMIYNGDLLSFPYCANPQFCTYTELVNYFNTNLKPDVSQCF